MALTIEVAVHPLLEVGAFVCLFDDEGPTGTPVKDAQRTKTHDHTTRVLAIVWGTNMLSGRTTKVMAWYRELVSEIGGSTIEDVILVGASYGSA